jgi:dipeptidase D
MTTQTDVYAGLEPPELWRHFLALNRIPRPSRKEARARAYVQQTAEAAGATWSTDASGNTVVRVPATAGCEGAPPVAIQAHLDMVCEKRPGVEHDFDRDPIRPRIEGDRIYAAGTTLGADNGIGAAAALAALTDRGLRHGPLELIFTVEEETGLHGAMRLDPGLVAARLLINLDSEDPRELTVGCAGGAGTILRLPVNREPAPPGWVRGEVALSGLKGGHSGVQIHEPLANAIKLLAHVLMRAREGGVPFRLCSVQGGNAHNAIPRDAFAQVVVPADALPAAEAAALRANAALRSEWEADEPNLRVDLRPVQAGRDPLAPADEERLLRLLERLPHGVLQMSEAFPGKVETSSNLAQVATGEEQVEISTSTRSFATAELERVQSRIKSLGEEGGAQVEVRDGYPGWEPDPRSTLLATSVRVYRQVFGVPPEVQVIHAGLECGVIVSSLPGMEAISFGPCIQGAHTPEEYVSVPTVEMTWRLLAALLAELAKSGR